MMEPKRGIFSGLVGRGMLVFAFLLWAAAPMFAATPGAGLYTFIGATDNGNGTFTTADGFFLISGSDGYTANGVQGVSADQYGAFINDSTASSSGTSYIEISVVGGGSFQLTSAIIGDYNSSALSTNNDFTDVRAVGMFNSQPVATTPAYSSVGAYQTNYNMDFTSFAGVTIDAIRVYYTWAVGSTEQTGFNVESITITGASTISPPAISTTAVSAITTSSAASGGNVTSDGGASVIARGVCWSTSQYPRTSDSLTTESGTIGSFASSLTGLSAGTTYYVRAYATNSVGTAYGDQVSFTTQLPPSATATVTPTITTTPTTTSTYTSSPTPTFTATETPTLTPTPTGTFTATPTCTLTETITETPTLTSTFTATASPALTSTPTPTETETSTVSATPTCTPTETTTMTPTSTSTPSGTASPILTSTATSTPTETPTLSPTPTETATITVTVTPTCTGTPSATASPVLSSTFTPTVSHTSTPSPVVTPVLTVTATVDFTVTPTETSVPAIVHTRTLGAGQILAYPNPVRSQLTLLIGYAGSDPVEVRIYNLTGELVCKMEAQPAAGVTLAKIDCSALAPGLYLVRAGHPGAEIAKCKIAVGK